MEPHEDRALITDALAAWTPPDPDPAAMDRVADAMMAAVMTPSEPAAAVIGEEVQFRLAAACWTAAVVFGYLTWKALQDWLFINPVYIWIAVSLGVIALLAPFGLLMVPALRPGESA